jgi:hypothetical protein
VQLLPAAGPVYIEYSTPPPINVLPCQSGSVNANCGAVAWDVGPTSRTDLTSYITMAVAPSCSSDTSGQQVRDATAMQLTVYMLFVLVH